MQLTTISGVEIKATPNHKTRTFRIVKNGIKYRTNQQNAVDFAAMQLFTANDWQQWLNVSGDYYSVK